MMLQIAETLPREMQGILACCNPIPPLVRSNLLELHKIVLKAREQPLERVNEIRVEAFRSRILFVVGPSENYVGSRCFEGNRQNQRKQCSALSTRSVKSERVSQRFANVIE